MPRGIYKCDRWVLVDFGDRRAPVDRRTYETSRYQPSYTDLPTLNDYSASYAD